MIGTVLSASSPALYMHMSGRRLRHLLASVQRLRERLVVHILAKNEATGSLPDQTITGSFPQPCPSKKKPNFDRSKREIFHQPECLKPHPTSPPPHSPAVFLRISPKHPKTKPRAPWLRGPLLSRYLLAQLQRFGEDRLALGLGTRDLGEGEGRSVGFLFSRHRLWLGESR